MITHLLERLVALLHLLLDSLLLEGDLASLLKVLLADLKEKTKSQTSVTG